MQDEKIVIRRRGSRKPRKKASTGNKNRTHCIFHVASVVSEIRMLFNLFFLLPFHSLQWAIFMLLFPVFFVVGICSVVILSLSSTTGAKFERERKSTIETLFVNCFRWCQRNFFLCAHTCAPLVIALLPCFPSNITKKLFSKNLLSIAWEHFSWEFFTCHSKRRIFNQSSFYLIDKSYQKNISYYIELFLSLVLSFIIWTHALIMKSFIHF